MPAAALLALAVALPIALGALGLVLGLKIAAWRSRRASRAPSAKDASQPLDHGVVATITVVEHARGGAKADSLTEEVLAAPGKPSPARQRPTPFALVPPDDPSPPPSPHAAAGAHRVPLSPVLKYKSAPEPGEQSCELALEQVEGHLTPQQLGAAVFSPAASARRLLSPAASSGVEIVLPAEVCHSDIQIIERLGQGAQGSVYRALWKGAAVAVKCMKVKFGDAESRNRVAREVFFSKLLHFPQVIQCLGWTWVSDCDGGKLQTTPSGRLLGRQASWGVASSQHARRTLMFGSEGSGDQGQLHHIAEAPEPGEASSVLQQLAGKPAAAPQLSVSVQELREKQALEEDACSSPLTSPSIRAVRPRGGAHGFEVTAPAGSHGPAELASPFGTRAWRAGSQAAGFKGPALLHGGLQQHEDPQAAGPSRTGSGLTRLGSSTSNLLGAVRGLLLGRRRSSDDESAVSVAPHSAGCDTAVALSGNGADRRPEAPPSGQTEGGIDLEMGFGSPAFGAKEPEQAGCAARPAASGDAVPTMPCSTPGPPSAPGTNQPASDDGRVDSFNSEDGFGSPYKRIFGTLRSVLTYEASALEEGQALIAIVMEYCDRGSLAGAIKSGVFRRSPDNPLAYRSLLRTAQEIAAGMNYIHGVTALVHGDLKPGNVLLKASSADARGFTAKVSDFGLCAEAHDPQAAGDLGTAPYVAPELWESTPATGSSDVYAFGIMLWEMFHCRAPFEGMDAMLISYAVMFDGYRPPFADDCPASLRDLVCACWHQEPRRAAGRRPAFERVWRELVQIEGSYRSSCQHSRKMSIGGSCAALHSLGPGSPAHRRRASRAASGELAASAAAVQPQHTAPPLLRRATVP